MISAIPQHPGFKANYLQGLSEAFAPPYEARSQNPNSVSIPGGWRNIQWSNRDGARQYGNKFRRV